MYEKGWFHRKNKSNRPRSIDVAYDSINVNIIYVFYNQTNLSEYWKATLSDRSREFNNATFYEVWQIQKIQKKAKVKHELANSKANEDLDSKIQDIIKNAEKLKPKNNQSKRQRISSINKNRETEKEKERTERTERRNSGLNREGNNIIRMPRTSHETKKLTEEELLLKFPNYRSNIFDED